MVTVSLHKRLLEIALHLTVESHSELLTRQQVIKACSKNTSHSLTVQLVLAH